MITKKIEVEKIALRPFILQEINIGMSLKVLTGGTMMKDDVGEKTVHRAAEKSFLRAKSASDSELQAEQRGEQALLAAYGDRRSDLMVQASGTVYRLLTDDLEGARHQRFILELSPGHTVLICHNIDIAPRVNDLREGDTIHFCGEYEWNERGGILHWTHHDPEGNDHPDGWLLHNDTYYQ